MQAEKLHSTGMVALTSSESYAMTCNQGIIPNESPKPVIIMYLHSIPCDHSFKPVGCLQIIKFLKLAYMSDRDLDMIQIGMSEVIASRS